MTSEYLGLPAWLWGFAAVGLFLVAVGVYHWRNPHRLGSGRRGYSSSEDMPEIWRKVAKAAAAGEIALGLGFLYFSARNALVLM